MDSTWGIGLMRNMKIVASTRSQRYYAMLSLGFAGVLDLAEDIL